MPTLHAPDVTDKVATHFIRNAARALVADGSFPRSDLEDVIQDLQLALLEQSDNFDPDRSRWSTFVKHVVRNTAISLRRRQRALCRQAQGELSSLNVLIADGDGHLIEFEATVGEEEFRTGHGQDFVPHPEQVELALDLAALLGTLSEELREICELLKLLTPTEARRELEISRTTMDRRLVALRELFRAAGVAPQD
ncbi:MAG: sigma-70 family RNA polymerase sigma factor [Planctomycetes bacterium]|nr:sigma-70 family RNA polymerase sigma factor [Planctomycetota bacterium]